MSKNGMSRLSRSVVLPLLLCVTPTTSRGQQDPVRISETDAQIWNHYRSPLRNLHSESARELLPFQNAVTLEVTVSADGDVESVQAIGGPKQFFVAAKKIEQERQFKPFELEGINVRAVVQDYVHIAPSERWNAPRVPFPEIKDLSTLRFALRRSGCFGTCPSYSIEVRGSGDIAFRGERYVLITGEHHAKLSQQAIMSLFQSFQSADYFSLMDQYEGSVTDNPTYTTSIEFDGHKKSVTDYVGSTVGMPDAVTELEDKFDELAGTDRWLHETSMTWPSLIAEGWNFRAQTEDNRALFANVTEHASDDLIQRFVSAGAPAFGAEPSGASALVNASGKGDLDLVRRMMSNKFPPSPELLFRSLRAGVHSGNLDLIEFLIRNGADVKGMSRDPNDRDTVLMSAVGSCRKDTVEKVLQYHPEVNARDASGASALARFLQTCSPESDIVGIFEILTAAGADVNSQDNQGQTALFSSSYTSDVAAVRLLAEAGADLNVKNKFGQTALMLSFSQNFYAALVAAGADLWVRDPSGLTAAQAARKMGANDKAEFLEAAMKNSSKGH